MLPSASTIEILPVELWFIIFDFFNLLELHRHFYGLNKKINSFLREKPGVKLILEYGSDYQYLKKNENELSGFFNKNVRSLSIYCWIDTDFLCSYPLQIYFTRIERLLFQVGVIRPVLLTEETIGQLKNLKYLSVDRVCILVPILKYLSINNESNSLKYLVINDNITIPKNLPINLEEKPINLKYFYVQSASCNSLLSLLPNDSTISNLIIHNMYESSVLPTSNKINKIEVQSLRIENIDDSASFDELRTLLHQFKNLKKLCIVYVVNKCLADGDRWALLLQLMKIEQFSLTFKDYSDDWRGPFIRPEDQATLLGRFKTDFWLKEKQAMINEKKHTWNDPYTLSVKFNIAT